MEYRANSDRYSKMSYRRCGKSGLQLPLLSLGLWHNFGHTDVFETSKNIILAAFDNGITHFDLANNYGIPAGSAEENFGKIINSQLKSYRDEIIVSTKAGFFMWDGPYGEWGSKKYLVSSMDQSLKRMGLDYVDIFYHHRPDDNTPIEETMRTLDLFVRQGKALYVGLSNYNAEQTERAIQVLRELGTPCLIHQPKYNMFDRWVEDRLLSVLEQNGIGSIAFSPLAQGLLTNRYLSKEVPEGSRMSKSQFLKPEHLTDAVFAKMSELNNIAQSRNQSLAQLAIAWLLKDSRISSVLIGASSVNQLLDNLGSLNNLHFSDEELSRIDSILHS